ncbi:hypothetical protein HK27_10175 [Acetobacter orientalis]|nr:hypothetical protein HK27_10175 [Acetobacter orientalis]
MWHVETQAARQALWYSGIPFRQTTLLPTEAIPAQFKMLTPAPYSAIRGIFPQEKGCSMQAS